MNQPIEKTGVEKTDVEKATEFVKQLTLFIPTVGVLINTGMTLVEGLLQNRNADEKTREEALTAIASLRQTIAEGRAFNEKWLEEHPPLQ